MSYHAFYGRQQLTSAQTVPLMPDYSARQMLETLPVRMANGGDAGYTAGVSAGRQNAIEKGLESGWLENVARVANTWLANPGTAPEAYDAMVKSGIGVKDLLDAGISQDAINRALSIPANPAQQQVNQLALTSMTSTLGQNPNMAIALQDRGAEALYAQARDFVSNLQQDGLTDAERRQLQTVASQQGWGYADIRAAGLDPSLLFGQLEQKPLVPPPAVRPPVPGGAPMPPQSPYTPVQVYQPLPSQPDLYAPGEPALDMDFRNSPPRTVSPVTGQYMYTPAAKLRPATGAGWSWTPPVVTSRPRELLDVGPTASASQLYAQSRFEQDRALRNAFASAGLPASGMDVSYWQSRLRGGDYSPTGTFDAAGFNQDFQNWAASRGSGTSGTSGIGGAIAQNQQMYDEFGNPMQTGGTGMIAPQMFLNMQPRMFAEGGEANARELLDRLKKPEGAEEPRAEEPGMMDRIARGARTASRKLAGLTPLSEMENYATRTSTLFYPKETELGGEADAMRHLLFQSELASRYGELPARVVGALNEYGLGTLQGQSPAERRMDLENDARGREIGRSGMSQDERLRAIMEMIDAGKATTLKESQLGYRDGGEVSTEELIAQMDRIGSQPVPAQEEPEQTESRSMLRRISDAFGQNVTAPVVGSLVDMTVGVGDIAQMGLKAGAEKLGMETEPFAPVSPGIQEALGTAGYDPYSPVAIGAQIAVPALGALRAGRAAGTVLSAAGPMTAREELARQAASGLAREGQLYAASEGGAEIARQVAPDSFGAELAGAMLGGTTFSTLDNLDPRTASTARSQMAEIYRHTPTPERPFVGRLDSYIANLDVGRISRDELLARMRGKFRGPELLRVERALADADPTAKLTPNEVLEKLQASYDPSDFEVVTFTRGTEGYLPDSYGQDNPWVNDPPSDRPPQGVVVVRRSAPEGSVSPGEAGRAGDAKRALDNITTLRNAGPLTPDSEYVWNLTDTAVLDSYSEPLARVFSGRQDDTSQFVLERLDNMELLAMSRREQAQELARIGARAGDVNQGLFDAEKARLLEQGGVPGRELLNQAYVNAFKQNYDNLVATVALESRYQNNFNLPMPDGVTTPGQATEFIGRTLQSAINNRVQQIGESTRARMAEQLNLLHDSEDVQKTLAQFASMTPVELPGVNPQYYGAHSSVTQMLEQPVSFSRTADVTAELPGMGQARGIYLFEMQSDLRNQIAREQGGIPRSMTKKEVQDTLDKAKSQLEVLTPQYQQLMDQINATERYTPEAAELNNRLDALHRKQNTALRQERSAAERLRELTGEVRLSKHGLDEAFPSMASDSKALQQMIMKAAVSSALNRGLNFVALTSPSKSREPQLYERVPQNAREVVKDLGEGFNVQQIMLRNRDGEFPVTAITWDQSTTEGREAVNRVVTKGVPFKDGGEVTTQPDDLKNLISFLDKKPARKRK